MIELKDSRQQLKFISDDLLAIRSVALLADDNTAWNIEGDVVRLIALAVEPLMRDVEEIIAKLGTVIGTKDSVNEDNYVQPK